MTDKTPGKVKVSKIASVPVTHAPVVDTTIAFKPFENSIFDMRDLLQMLDDLTLIERALFRGKVGTISSKAKDFTSSGVVSIFEELEKTGMEPAEDAGQMKFMKDLIGYLKNLPMVKVTLAFYPTNSYVEKLSNEISGLLGKKVILDLLVDEHIVGGAVFEYGGKVSRKTLDTVLDDVLTRQGREIQI